MTTLHETAETTVEDRFWSIVLGETDWLRDEFAEIVAAAERGGPPPPPRLRSGPGPRHARRLPVADGARPGAATPALPVRGGWRPGRERAPPVAAAPSRTDPEGR